MGIIWDVEKYSRKEEEKKRKVKKKKRKEKRWKKRRKRKEKAMRNEFSTDAKNAADQPESVPKSQYQELLAFKFPCIFQFTEERGYRVCLSDYRSYVRQKKKHVLTTIETGTKSWKKEVLRIKEKTE